MTRSIGTLGVLSVVLLPSILAAQATSSSIAGVVKDSTGTVLPAVTVEASSPALIEKTRAAVTDAEGNYKIVDLRPGTYSIRFGLTGFSTVKREGVELTSGFTANVNAELNVGAVADMITVSGATPVIDVQNARVQAVLSRDALNSLPLGWKTTYSFNAMTPGVVTSAFGQDVGGSQGELDGSPQYHGVNSSDAKYNLVLRDEVDRTSMFDEIVGTSPSLQPVLARVARVAGADSIVLIAAETGTAKELVAHAVHRRSANGGAPGHCAVDA